MLQKNQPETICVTQRVVREIGGKPIPVSVDVSIAGMYMAQDPELLSQAFVISKASLSSWAPKGLMLLRVVPSTERPSTYEVRHFDIGMNLPQASCSLPLECVAQLWILVTRTLNNNLHASCHPCGIVFLFIQETYEVFGLVPEAFGSPGTLRVQFDNDLTPSAGLNIPD